MKIISLLGDAVLASRVPEEKVTSIKTTELTMTLGRHSPDKLDGLKIGGKDGRFVLPADEEVLKSRITTTGFVDTQVWIVITLIDCHKQILLRQNTAINNKLSIQKTI